MIRPILLALAMTAMLQLNPLPASSAVSLPADSPAVPQVSQQAAAPAQKPGKPAGASTEDSLTIYNQQFAVVRQMFPLDLTSGVNHISFSGATAHLESDSVILRDPGGRRLQVLEQNYRNDPVSQELLLSLFEGKIIDFEVMRDGHSVIIPGKIIRSGYYPHASALQRYGAEYYQQQYATASSSQPIIELQTEKGPQLHFGLPGTPIFPSLGTDTILKPTLEWQLRTDRPGAFDAEVSYISGGMNWQADYNLVLPEHGDTIDLVGWVTLDNQSGKTFDHARIKLLAGDVNKIAPQQIAMKMRAAVSVNAAVDEIGPMVREKSFDDFHLYSLANPVTLRDRETKQVEFVSAAGIKSHRLYVYDGANIANYAGWSDENIRDNREYGTQSNPKVWMMCEFQNSTANNLGIALPKGRLRFYRRDEGDGNRLEFTGENIIDHTPADETVRVFTGNAFDIVGERKRTNFVVNNQLHTADETFEIKLRNHKDSAVEVRVVERLYRWSNWQLTQQSDKFIKTDSRSIEFRVPVPAKGAKTVTYTVHYSWL